MNVPFTAVQFVVYESGKRALVASHLLDSTDEEVRACTQLRLAAACRGRFRSVSGAHGPHRPRRACWSSCWLAAWREGPPPPSLTRW
jgi:hypothetical protein